MFVLKSKYEKSLKRTARLEKEIEYLSWRRDRLEHQVLGRDIHIAELESKLRSKLRSKVAVEKVPEYTFTTQEIKQLISLCHPDKHNGRVLSKEMTQKLLKIRG